MAILVDQKYISYKDSIIKHWPTFASTHGDFEKAKLRVKDVMRHESGLVRMEKCYDLENFMPYKIKVKPGRRAAADAKDPYPLTLLGTYIGWLIDKSI